MDSLIFLLKKRYSKIKSRTVENGSTQRAYIGCDNAAILTGESDDIIITGVVEEKKGRYIMIKDIPNAFVQKAVPQEEGYKIIIMNICGALAEILCMIRPEIYKP